MKMKEKDKKSTQVFKTPASIIYDEIAQNLCLVKVKLAMTENMKVKELRENIRKTNELVTKSIQQLRDIGSSLQEAEKNCLQSKK